MKISLPESLTELKSWLRHLDKNLLEKLLEYARQCYRIILEQLDDALAECRNHGLRIEHYRVVWYQTCLGAVYVKRRVYRDRKGQRRCLLDELMGMSKRDHTTVTVKEIALYLATNMPYRRAAEVLRQTSAIDLTHQTIHRLMGKVADPYLEKAQNELEWFLETGEVAAGEGRPAHRLMIEADGVMLSLQREKERRIEVKLGIAYEGWERVSKDRYRTVNKRVYTAIDGGDGFWAGMSLKLHELYDLSGVKDTIVGGDGARWVKAGAEYVGGRYQLDRYHLNRELTAAFGRDNETKSQVRYACQRGDVDTALQIMADAMKQARGEQAQRLAKAYTYLRENRSGLVDYRLALGEAGKGLRHTGAIEGNVDKFVVRRMKNQGMSWRVKGISRLLCVRLLVFEGKLAQWLGAMISPVANISVPVKTARRLVNRLSMQEPDEWLKAGLPALYGPHASRPWVEILRSLSKAQSI